VVIEQKERAWGEALGLARVLSQPCPHDVKHPNCAVPLLTIAELDIELKKTGRGVNGLERPGVESGLKGVLRRWHRVSYRGMERTWTRRSNSTYPRIVISTTVLREHDVPGAYP
jgi:hypothetical protein